MRNVARPNWTRFGKWREIQYPDKQPCPICSGTFLANRQYMGFDAVMITEWKCDGCGRVVKIAKVSGSEARKAPEEVEEK